MSPVQSTLRAGTSIADQSYAQSVRKLINLVTDLRALGAQADIDLPRIAVIGNQSAGKSSLVEAICDISVPRDSGTCTRCPMECRLSNSTTPWKCQVLLRIERDEYGNRLLDTTEEPFGDVITDKTQLEPMLRRAQLAILNPSVPSEKFVNFDLALLQSATPPLRSTRQLQFSSNVVCLNLSGTDVPDLSFIDLPGIISNVAEGEDRNNITLVQNLVKEHIQGNALILLTITMRDDLENQSAAFLAKQADPKGLRTIGVLTKPDTLQSGEHQQWLEVLHGRRHALHHGYYVTKQPGVTELADKLPYEEARCRETEFFATTAPWNSVGANIKARMGVKNLTQELSRLLSRLIEQTLPKLRTQSRESKMETDKALRLLPPKVSENPTGELFHLVTAFCSTLDKVILGGDGHECLIQDCRKAYEQFQHNIRSTTPIFHAKPQRQCPNPSNHTTLQYQATALSISTRDYDPSPSTPESSEDGVTSNCLVMDVDEVRAYIAKSITRQLPYNTPFSSKVGLIECCFEDWPVHAQEAFDSVYRTFKATLNTLVLQHFSRFENGGLADYTGTIVETLLNTVRDETSDRIKWLLELEHPPFTLNDNYFSSYREKYLAQYRGERHHDGVIEYEARCMRETLSALAKLGLEVGAGDLQKLHGPDPYDQEMFVMAEVRAYFQVAYKRIIDMLPRVIDHDFLKALGKRMHDVLVAKLGLDQDNASHRAAHWLSEDPDVVHRRAELEAKKGRLDEILDKLHNFRT